MEMYPKDKHFENTQEVYLSMKGKTPCELCLKPGYGYYIRVFHNSDDLDNFPLMENEVIFEHVGPNRKVSYEFPIDSDVTV